MIFGYIKVWIYHFLRPVLIHDLDETVRRGLSQYFNEQAEQRKQYSAYLSESQDFMRNLAREHELQGKNHSELMLRFDRLIGVIENK